MAAAQASLFGVRSLPGFEAFNSELANRNRDNADIYTYTGATEHDEKGEPVNPWAQYVMYGLGTGMVVLHENLQIKNNTFINTVIRSSTVKRSVLDENNVPGMIVICLVIQC